MTENSNSILKADAARLISPFSAINVLFLIASLILILGFFCHLETISFGNYFNSDSLYLPALYVDLFVDKNGLQGWHLNPAPNFFPDMGFYFLLMFLLNSRFIIASFVFSLIQYFFILFLLVRLFKAIVPDQSPKFHAIIYGMQLIWLLEFFYFSGNFIFGYFLFSNSYHTGCFVMTLCCMLLSLGFLKNQGWGRPVLLFVLVFLSTLSDKLFAVSFVIPAMLAGLFFLRRFPKVALVLILVPAVSAATGFWVYQMINTSEYIYFDDSNMAISPERMTVSYNHFVRLMKECIQVFGYRTIAICLFLTSIACLVFLLVRRWKSAGNVLKFSLLFIIIQSVVLISSPVICGLFFGWDSFRYNIYPAYLTGLNFSIFLAMVVRRSSFTRLGYKYGMSVAAVCLLVAGISRNDHESLTNFFGYYPDKARRIDEIAEKEGLLKGVANYWDAKSTTMFSRKGIKIYAVYDDLFLYTHVANHNWFLDQNNKFNFVLLSRFTDTATYKQKLKCSEVLYNEPVINNEPGFVLAKTNVFTFNRWTFHPENN